MSANQIYFRIAKCRTGTIEMRDKYFSSKTMTTRSISQATDPAKLLQTFIVGMRRDKPILLPAMTYVHFARVTQSVSWADVRALTFAAQKYFIVFAIFSSIPQKRSCWSCGVMSCNSLAITSRCHCIKHHVKFISNVVTFFGVRRSLGKCILPDSDRYSRQLGRLSIRSRLLKTYKIYLDFRQVNETMKTISRFFSKIPKKQKKNRNELELIKQPELFRFRCRLVHAFRLRFTLLMYVYGYA